MTAKELAASLTPEQAAAMKQIIAAKEAERLAAVVAHEKGKDQHAKAIKAEQRRSSDLLTHAREEAENAAMAKVIKVLSDKKKKPEERIEAVIFEFTATHDSKRRAHLKASIAAQQAQLDALSNQSPGA